MNYENRISELLAIKPGQTATVLKLLAEGSTIPFIARYRKDATGALDETVIAKIEETHKTLVAIDERRDFILKTIEAQGKLTDELKAQIESADALSRLEDLYLPYMQKRKTRAVIAREKGLQPLADLLLQQQNKNVEEEAADYISDQVPDSSAALQGARDIIAEQVNEDAEIRNSMRQFFEKGSSLISKLAEGKENEAIKFKDYFDYSGPITNIPAHRVLAILRGFLEGFLRISIEPDQEKAIALLEDKIIKQEGTEKPHLQKALKDAYRRLLQPSLETEMRNALKEKADEESIHVFAENLRQLLLSSPLGSKTIIAIDPGYRTGCKVVCLDKNGDLLDNDLIYVHETNRMASSEALIRSLVKRFAVEAFAIGDGTAGRETEQFIKQMQLGLPVFLVNEDGASIYSASEVAREEFPDKDITVRGAVSIGRRLMDPLAELVKIDPKSIGVGQYQHDVNQSKLKEKLDQTVMSCVNSVGVNLNTASRHLLSYVSGIGGSVAQQIVKYRSEKGGFTNREELLQVPRFGAKAFEQSAGFLRIANAVNPLDASGVHPEAYALVQEMATKAGIQPHEIVGNEKVLQSLMAKDFVSDKYGMHTVNDVIKELRKPGLDPRQEASQFEFAQIFSIDDVQPGMEVPGIVTNLTKFGAFVDIGVKQDGLVHISEITNRYISDPAEALKLNEKVQVKVLEVDKARKRISLSIKQLLPAVQGFKKPKPKQEPASMQDALSALKNKFGKA